MNLIMKKTKNSKKRQQERLQQLEIRSSEIELRRE
jgi:hypothetical protein